MTAHHAAPVSTMLALLAPTCCGGGAGRFRGCGATVEAGGSRVARRVLDIVRRLHRMTPQWTSMVAASGTPSRATRCSSREKRAKSHGSRSLLENVGGDDWRERQSATLVVAWMSPRFSSGWSYGCRFLGISRAGATDGREPGRGKKGPRRRGGRDCVRGRRGIASAGGRPCKIGVFLSP